MGMSRRLYDRDAAIAVLLSVARRETLMLAAAVCALDDDAAAIASARLRWAIGSARPLIAEGDRSARGGSDVDQARHAEQLDRIANRAQRWLVAEVPRPLPEIGQLIERAARRDR